LWQHPSFQNTFSQKRLFADKPKSVATLSQLSESFLDGTSANYVEQMYQAWQKDPNSVHVSWSSYFSNINKGAAPGKAFSYPPSLGGQNVAVPVAAAGAIQGNFKDVIAIHSLIRAYQRDGHLLASLDPLHFTPNLKAPQLDHKFHGFTDADLNREFPIESSVYKGGFVFYLVPF
jgi:2-oxoglutarate dehydrogenase E1 component